MKFRLSEETIQAAFDVLEKSVEAGAYARAMRERREDEKKEAKARAFLKASGSVAEREAQSILDPGYQESCTKYYEAVEADERWRAERSRCEAIFALFQTMSANNRALGKVG